MNKSEYISHQINISLKRADWWIAFSKTKACLDRKIYHGLIKQEYEYTDDEKIQDALDTADRHIHNANKLLHEVEVE